MNSLYLCDVAEIFREGKLSDSRENYLMLFQSLLNVLHGTAHFSCAAAPNILCQRAFMSAFLNS